MSNRDPEQSLLDRIDAGVEAARLRLDDQHKQAAIVANQRHMDAMRQVRCTWTDCQNSRSGMHMFCARHLADIERIAERRIVPQPDASTRLAVACAKPNEFDAFLRGQGIDGVYALALMTTDDRDHIMAQWVQVTGAPKEAKTWPLWLYVAFIVGMCVFVAVASVAAAWALAWWASQ